MKRIFYAVIISVVFALPAFAETTGYKGMYLTLDNYFHKELGFSPDKPVDSNFYYNPGLTVGIQARDFLACEFSLSYLPDDAAFGDGLFDIMVILQKQFEKNVSGFGFRPYVGLGGGLVWDSNSDITMFGRGLAFKGGIRYYNGPFLIGAGIDWHYYWASLSNSYTSPAEFSYRAMKVGLNVGFIF